MKISGKISRRELDELKRWRARLEVQRNLEWLRRQPSDFEYGWSRAVHAPRDQDEQWYADRLRELIDEMQQYIAAGEHGKARVVAGWFGALSRDRGWVPSLRRDQAIAAARNRGNRARAIKADPKKDEARQMFAQLQAQGVPKAAAVVAFKLGISERWVYQVVKKR